MTRITQLPSVYKLRSFADDAVLERDCVSGVRVEDFQNMVINDSGFCFPNANFYPIPSESLKDIMIV